MCRCTVYFFFSQKIKIHRKKVVLFNIRTRNIRSKLEIILIQMNIKKVIKPSFILLNVDHVKLGGDWNFRNVISPYITIYYIDEGEGFVIGKNAGVKLNPGYLYLIPGFTQCNFQSEGNLSQYFVQFFEESPNGISLFSNNLHILQTKAEAIDVANFKRLIAINPGRGLNQSHDPFSYEKESCSQEFLRLNCLQNIAVQYETQGIILQLISKFLKSELLYYPRNDTRSPVVLETMEYIEAKISNTLNVCSLARRAGLSVNYFSKIFYKNTGQSPIKYILQKKIERAQYLITTTDKQQGEIAELSGFDNVQYFLRVFKRITGSAPGAYRSKNRIPRHTLVNLSDGGLPYHHDATD
jgi:AraC-like DNA-binding protein